MVNVVMLGGNGYLGREVTRQWLARDPQARFWVLSRSGHNELTSERIVNSAVDLADESAVAATLPETVDYVLDFVGGPAKNDEENRVKNLLPVQVMTHIARQKKVRAVGFVGGVFGPSAFTKTKSAQIEELRQTGIPLAVVEPTVLYGAGRRDVIAKMVPVFKVLGAVMKNAKPMLVTDVASDLLAQITAY